MAPVAFGFKIPQAQFGSQTVPDAGDAVGDLAGYKLKTAPRAFMVEQNPIRAIHAVRLAVVHGQVKAGDFADAVRAARMERRALALRGLAHFAEHLARACEVKPAVGLQLTESRQHVMRAVDVGGHGGEAIREA